MDQRKYDHSSDLLKTEVVAWLEKEVVPSEVKDTVWNLDLIFLYIACAVFKS
jgi:hypothetical protein